MSGKSKERTIADEFLDGSEITPESVEVYLSMVRARLGAPEVARLIPPKNVLVVEQDDAARDQLAAVLTARRFRVFRAGDALAGLCVATANPIDVAVIDGAAAVEAVLSGTPIMQKLRHTHPQMRLILVIDPAAQLADRQYAELVLGLAAPWSIDNFVYKPIHLRALINIIEG